MSNEAIARIFLEIADLLDLEGVKFKPEAYRRAARALQQAPEETEELVRTGRIGQVPGIGEALSEKVREFVRTGQVPYLEKLRAQWPAGLLELMRLEGVGPKTTRRFYLEFQVTGPEDLRRLLQEGKLQGVFGFGPRKIELLRQALSRGASGAGEGPGGGRTPLPEAQARADELLEALRDSGAPIAKLVYAGSLRRRRETVGDLDLLATSTSPREVMALFTKLPQVQEVRLSGDTKSTVLLEGGLQVDLRVVPPEAFGAALQYFTGSKDHNVHLRSLANKKGLSINEYGLTRGDHLVPAPTEEEVYAAVDLPYIPPEMREDQGEIEASQAGKLPPVIAEADLRGELHIHVPPSIEAEDLQPWAEGLEANHLSYGGFVLRAAELENGGRSLETIRQELPRKIHGVRVFLGVEVTLDLGAKPRLPPGADFLSLRPPEKPIPSGRATGEKLVELLQGVPATYVHVDPSTLASSGLAWRDLLPTDGRGPPVEVAVRHDRVENETARVREAVERSVPLVLSGVPRLPEELPRLRLAAGIARRAWAPPGLVVNAAEDPVVALAERPSVGGEGPEGRGAGPRPAAHRRGGR